MALAGAILANFGTKPLPAPPSSLAVDLVAIAPPEPMMPAPPTTVFPTPQASTPLATMPLAPMPPAPMPSAPMPPTATSPPPAPPEAPAATAAPVATRVSTAFATAIAEPETKLVHVVPRPTPPPMPRPRQVALAAHHPPASHPPASSALNAPPASAPAAASPAPPAPSAPATAHAATASPPADWLRAIAAWLAAHRTYPQQARREGEQGTVVLRLVIARDGTVRDATLLEGSGHADLDLASLAAVRAARLPPAPTADAPAELTLRVPIRYALETSN